MEGAISKKSKQETKPWAKAEPYILGAAQDMQGAYRGSQQAIGENTSAINSTVPLLAQQFAQPGANTMAARGYVGDVLAGKYLNDNQHLNGMIDQTSRGVSDRVNNIFSRSGRTGGTQHVGALGSELADSENRLRYQNYSDERSAMGSAAAMAPGLDQSQLAYIAPLLAAAQGGAMLPVQAAGAQSQGQAGLLSPYTTTTQTQSPWQTIGNLAGLGFAAFGGGGPLAGMLGGGGASNAMGIANIMNGRG